MNTNQNQNRKKRPKSKKSTVTLRKSTLNHESLIVKAKPNASQNEAVAIEKPQTLKILKDLPTLNLIRNLFSNFSSKEKVFTPYQIFVIALLAFLQFTVIFNFMIMSPLSAILLDELNITPVQFSRVVSAYAIAAGFSALISSIIADRFDRKKYLLFFYIGFVVGTIYCSFAPDYNHLLIARAVSGMFGGVLASISLAIVADLFPYNVRGRVMGVIMTAFSASQIVGLPSGIFMATHFGWHSPFMLIVGISIPVGLLVLFKLKPITTHLTVQQEEQSLKRMVHIVTRIPYLEAFATTALLATGGFMLMPFGTAFSVYNLGLSLDEVSSVFLVTGIVTVITGPIVGRLSDAYGKYTMFLVGSGIAAVVVLFYTRLGITPLWLVMTISAVVFMGISARMVSATALISAIPGPADRGSFMSINSSVQQFSGGIASMISGWIVIKTAGGALLHYEIVGMLVALTTIITAGLMYRLHRRRHERDDEADLAAPTIAVHAE